MAYSFGFVIFFFKQKTAYEMRISDWSSDVCSSDLSALIALPADVSGPALERALQTILDRHDVLRARLDAATHQLEIREPGSITAPDIQNGRASCRERVCKYV